MAVKNFYTRYSKSFIAARGITSGVLQNINLPKSIYNITRINFPKNFPIVIIVGLLLAIAFFAGTKFGNGGSFNTFDERADAPSAIATQALNKSFKFPLLDSEGKEVSRIDYVVETANLQDAFIYQGKLAKAVKGRTFLIFNLKITNPYSKSIEINSRDYIRIKLNNSSEQVAPEIHSDPVEIQADSTKYTRIGLPINDTDKNIVVLVGEIGEKKETIKLGISR